MNLIRVLLEREVILYDNGEREVLREHLGELPVSDAIVRAFCALRGSTPEAAAEAALALAGDVAP